MFNKENHLAVLLEGDSHKQKEHQRICKQVHKLQKLLKQIN